MKVIAKCTNYSGCLVAYRGEKIELEGDAPLVCPECGKPLAPAAGGSAAMMKIAAIAVGVLVVAAGGYFAVKAMKKPGTPAPAPSGEIAGTDTPGETPDVTPGPPVDPDEPPAPVPAPEPGDTTPPGPKPETKADNTPATKEIKSEVIERIDSMPDLSRVKRDQLTLRVQQAADMRRIVMVAFDSGQATLGDTQKVEVKKILDSAEVMRFRDDLTAVFVVLGFADSKGDDAKNLAISRARGNSVKDFIVRECGVKNVAHSIGMGSSTLIDENNLEKNRIAEIWAVLP